MNLKPEFEASETVSMRVDTVYCTRHQYRIQLIDILGTFEFTVLWRLSRPYCSTESAPHVRTCACRLRTVRSARYVFFVLLCLNSGPHIPLSP